jgi:hypothetical protein
MALWSRRPERATVATRPTVEEPSRGRPPLRSLRLYESVEHGRHILRVCCQRSVDLDQALAQGSPRVSSLSDTAEEYRFREFL